MRTKSAHNCLKGWGSPRSVTCVPSATMSRKGFSVSSKPATVGVEDPDSDVEIKMVSREASTAQGQKEIKVGGPAYNFTGVAPGSKSSS